MEAVEPILVADRASPQRQLRFSTLLRRPTIIDTKLDLAYPPERGGGLRVIHEVYNVQIKWPAVVGYVLLTVVGPLLGMLLTLGREPFPAALAIIGSFVLGAVLVQRYSPVFAKGKLRQAVAGRISSLAEPQMELTRSATASAAKRILDIVVAIIGLGVLSPLLLLIALAIRFESSGPIIFRQRRFGLNGRPYIILKFRTMKAVEKSEWNGAAGSDDRITRVGRILRRTYLDELPQLLNVIRGDMSLIGPRPLFESDSDYARAIAKYASRAGIKPGIMGWAQLNGYPSRASEITILQRRAEFDLWYIQNWSLWLDLKILFVTALRAMRA